MKNQIYLFRFGHTKALLFEKKYITRNDYFPRPVETDPYMVVKVVLLNSKMISDEVIAISKRVMNIHLLVYYVLVLIAMLSLEITLYLMISSFLNMNC